MRVLQENKGRAESSAVISKKMNIQVNAHVLLLCTSFNLTSCSLFEHNDFSEVNQLVKSPPSYKISRTLVEAVIWRPFCASLVQATSHVLVF